MERPFSTLATTLRLSGLSLDDIAEFNVPDQELLGRVRLQHEPDQHHLQEAEPTTTTARCLNSCATARSTRPFYRIQPYIGRSAVVAAEPVRLRLSDPVIIPHLYEWVETRLSSSPTTKSFRQNLAVKQPPASVPLADEMNAKFDASVLGNFTTAQLGGASATLTQCGHTYHVGDPHPLFNPFDPSGCPFPAASDGSCNSHRFNLPTR